MNASIVQFEQSVVTPLGSDTHIIKTKFKDNCFIYQSFGYKTTDFGDRLIRPHVSFLADGGEGVAAEWEPQYGPIQKWNECTRDWVGENSSGHEIKSRKHWHYDFVQDNNMMWSQLAVDEEDLKGKLTRGYLDSVFDVLLRWAVK